MKVKGYILIVVLVVALISPVISKSQSEESDLLPETIKQGRFSSKDKEIHEMVEILREIHLIRELNLSKEKAGVVIKKLRHARNLKRKYLAQRHSIEDKLDALLDAPAPNQTEITMTLQELESAKQQYYQQIMHSDKELWQILNPEERAKYVLFQRTFNKKLKEIILTIRQQNVNPPQEQNQLLRRKPAESVIRQNK